MDLVVEGEVEDEAVLPEVEADLVAVEEAVAVEEVDLVLAGEAEAMVVEDVEVVSVIYLIRVVLFRPIAMDHLMVTALMEEVAVLELVDLVVVEALEVLVDLEGAFQIKEEVVVVILQIEVGLVIKKYLYNNKTRSKTDG